MFPLLRKPSHYMQFCFYLTPMGNLFLQQIKYLGSKWSIGHKSRLTLLTVHSTLKWSWKRQKQILLRVSSSGSFCWSSPAFLIYSSRKYLLSTSHSSLFTSSCPKAFTIEWNRGRKRQLQTAQILDFHHMELYHAYWPGVL